MKPTGVAQAVSSAFAGDRSPAVLLAYQQRWCADQSPVKVIEKSRRVGLSWGEAADSALLAASLCQQATAALPAEPRAGELLQLLHGLLAGGVEFACKSHMPYTDTIKCYKSRLISQ